MKKNCFYSLVFLFMSLPFFSSCDIDNNTVIYPQPLFWSYWQPYQVNGNGQYVIGGYVNGQSGAITRAAIDGGTYTDFALYAWAKDSVVMGKDNDYYHGTFAGNVWGYTENLKYFDNDVDEYNFIGVIPQDATKTFDEASSELTVEAMGFTTDDEAAQAGAQNGTYAEDRELLYAATTVPQTKYGEGATLNFKHANVKIYLKFTSDDPNTQIVDFTPYTEGSPEVPATPGTMTTETRTSKVIDELVAGNIVGWPYAVDANLTSTQANNFFGSSNATYGGYLQAIANVVNAQFEYYDADGNIINTDWKYSPDNTTNVKRNVYFIKLASTTSASDFASGNDAFWTNADNNLKTIFQKAYNEGWRVVRINNTDSEKGWSAWLVNNTQMTLTVTTITGGTEYQPAIPPTGKEGIVILPATSEIGDGTDAVLASYPSKITATIGLDGITMSEINNESTLTFTKPNGYVYTDRVASPTTWYTFPYTANSVENVGYTVKFSYTYKGVTKYDNRVFIPSSEVKWVEGKFYTYIINIKGKGNGVIDPTETDEDDPKVPKTNEITVTTVINDYQEGTEHEHTIK